ncbi:MAG: hypothetical protein Q7J84_15940 [Sulfuricaulis sp.]|nr:hypothetical protein [Sulfuricaulis sp.]
MTTLEASGTQAATVGTEHTLTTLAVSKTLWPEIDISALAAGEFVEVRIKTKTLSGGTTRTQQVCVFSWLDAGVTPGVDGEPIISDQEYILTLKQVGGTGRSFPWKVLSP